MTLPRLVEGFSNQHGAIFGFGPKANNHIGNILKAEGVIQAKRRKLVNAPIQNLNEERSVGFINYEISIHRNNIWKQLLERYQQNL